MTPWLLRRPLRKAASQATARIGFFERQPAVTSATSSSPETGLDEARRRAQELAKFKDRLAACLLQLSREAQERDSDFST